MVMGVDRVFRCIRVRILVDRCMGIDLRCVDGAEGIVPDRVLHDLREIRRTGIVLRIIETRRVREMRIHTAELRRLLVHELCKLFIGARDVLGEGVCTVISRLEQKTIETVPHGELIARNRADDRRVLLEIPIDRGIGEGDLVFEIRTVLQDNDGGQHLRDRSGVVGGRRVLFIQYGAGIGIDEDRALGFDREVRCRPGRRIGGEWCESACRQGGAEQRRHRSSGIREDVPGRRQHPGMRRAAGTCGEGAG